MLNLLANKMINFSLITKKIKDVPLEKLSGAAARTLHPSLANLWARDLTNVLHSPQQSAIHLRETMDWLKRAHDAGGGKGVAGGFSLVEGWLAPYPETTGYIIPTFYDFAEFSGENQWRERAEAMADWEIEVQMPCGAVQAGLYKGANSGQKPAVFNTGQVILGWCRTFLETADERYLDAAKRAGDWLVGEQSEDGAWRVSSSETETSVHAYDVRTAWSLLEIYDITKDEKYLESARKKIEWTLAQQHKNGWFENNAFFTSDGKWTLPLTHTIAYVMEGLQESWRILQDKSYLQAVELTAEKLLRIFELRHFMAGEFDEKWKSDAKFSCLTGNAQIAGAWLKLFQTTKDMRFLNSALKLNDYTKSTQNIKSKHGGIRGGIKGSQPIYGKYTPFIFVNWGAKFFADTLLREENVMLEFEKTILN